MTRYGCLRKNQFQSLPSASSVHAFRKAEQSFCSAWLRKVISQKLCQGGIYVAIGHAIDADFEHMILHYFIVVLCSPEQMYSPTVQRVLIHRYLHSNVISI